MKKPLEGTKTLRARAIRAAATVALGAALAGGPAWAAREVQPGTPMDSVRFSLGIPDAIRFDGTGAQAWEYTGRRAPSGAYRLIFDTQGTVREAVALRTPERLARIQPGQTTGMEVVELLGEPSKVTVGERGTLWLFPRHGARPLEVTLGSDRKVRGLAGLE